MISVVIVGSIAQDDVVMLDARLRPGSHNSASLAGGRIGGGAANTAMAMARAGDRVRVLSAVGPDQAGASLLAQLSGVGVDTSLVSRAAHETTRSLVIIDPDGERTVVNLARAAVPLPAEAASLEADWCYVRSADPALTPVLQQLLARGVKVLAHIPPVTDGLRPARVLVGSASDLDAAFLAAPFASARRVAGDALDWMVVTEGENGAVAYGANKTIRQAAREVVVVDSTGAGDVFAGGLMHALGAGASMAEALRIAVHWGTASVAYAGTIPPAGFPGSAL
jgi:sugar/nucleoside kinase (ribokinase family)